MSHKKLRYNVEFWDMIRGPRKHEYYLTASSGCAQACLNMPKVTTNSDSVLSQEWVELWS